MGARHVRDELLRHAKLAASQGWFPGSSGNLSVLNRADQLVYVKGTGTPVAQMDESSIVVVDLEGNVIEGMGRPTKELGFHLGIYKRRPDVSAVIHSHSPYATAFAIAGVEMPLVTGPAQKVLQKVPLVPYAPAGSSELARHVTDSFADPDVKTALLRGHGVVAVGRDLSEAYKFADWLEDNARQAVLVSWVQHLFNKPSS